jgi:four helix bundle protein
VSIAGTIAEGYRRGSRPDYLRFLKFARGSLYEVETRLQFARELEYLSDGAMKLIEPLITDCAMLLSGLIRRLEGT